MALGGSIREPKYHSIFGISFGGGKKSSESFNESGSSRVNLTDRSTRSIDTRDLSRGTSTSAGTRAGTTTERATDRTTDSTADLATTTVFGDDIAAFIPELLDRSLNPDTARQDTLADTLLARGTSGVAADRALIAPILAQARREGAQTVGRNISSLRSSAGGTGANSLVEALGAEASNDLTTQLAALEGQLLLGSRQRESGDLGTLAGLLSQPDTATTGAASLLTALRGQGGTTERAVERIGERVGNRSAGSTEQFSGTTSSEQLAERIAKESATNRRTGSESFSSRGTGSTSSRNRPGLSIGF